VDFMITQRSTKVSSASEVINSFVMISHDKPFITEAELRATLPSNQVDYCIKHMKQMEQGYDYKDFVNNFFAASSTEESHAVPQRSLLEGWTNSRAEKVKLSQQKRNQNKENAEAKAREQEARFAQEKSARETARSTLLEKK